MEAVGLSEGRAFVELQASTEENLLLIQAVGDEGYLGSLFVHQDEDPCVAILRADGSLGFTSEVV